ncbi:MAG: phytanoyl-CoA dioxygenase family protein [Gemmatimonadota bacterium]|nr:phytanoyl-CoA dioxygenase family protein [Gemmatimonadota bacterium]
MTLQEALHELWVRDDTLFQAEKAHLDSEGYVLLPNILSAAQIASICSAMDGVYAAEGTGQKDGPAESSYMQNKTAGLDICFTHPRVLAAICHVLDGCIKSFGVHGRPHPPGGEQQALHVDYNGPAPHTGHYAVCNSLWMLTEFTPENGATRVIPGTHRSGEDPKEALEDPAAAGTVAVFNSHVWHGTTRNRSASRRPSLTSFFCRRDDPHMVFSSALSPAAARRLPPAACCMFADPEPWTG